MRGAQAFAGVAVEVFMEEEQVLPVRVMGEELRFAGAARAVDGPVAVRITNEDMDETIGQARGQSAEGEHLYLAIAARSRGHHRGGIRFAIVEGDAYAAAERLLQLTKGLDCLLYTS